MNRRRTSPLPWVAAVGLGVAAVALLLRPRRVAAAPAPAPAPKASPLQPSVAAAPAPAPTASPLHPSEAYADGAWFPVRLTEYHPDAPAKAQKMEGGPLDMAKVPVITVEQHLSDPIRYPYVTVASDEVLHGQPVAYGTRLYLANLPQGLASAVFRIADTGGNFRAPLPGQAPSPKRNKKIREPGHEPLDVATAWPGKTWKLNGQLQTARIDRADILPDPRRQRPRAPNA